MTQTFFFQLGKLQFLRFAQKESKQIVFAAILKSDRHPVASPPSVLSIEDIYLSQAFAGNRIERPTVGNIIVALFFSGFLAGFKCPLIKANIGAAPHLRQVFHTSVLIAPGAGCMSLVTLMGRMIVDAIWACWFRDTQVFGRKKNIFAGKRFAGSLDAQHAKFGITHRTHRFTFPTLTFLYATGNALL